MIREWHKEPLAWHHIKNFDKVIRKGDLIECLSNGSSVQASLEWAINEGGGDSWAVVNKSGGVVGVYGWTKAGGIWSYWKDLGAREIRELMWWTPIMVLEMVEKAQRERIYHLANYVWEDNKEAIAWLKGSHCFSLDLDHRHTIGNKQFIAFKTKPVEELRRYV